ncbi:MAG: RNA 2',3'-cyclic phosphodiesterase [Deltaproteobacteria bacterium]|nr:RNA 2',3'-cyclic phosphodiesterase [Deltaproteobacteria bacterium]
MDKIRCFIAIAIPEELREKLRRIKTALDAGYRGVSWTKPENIHLTLKFLAEIDAASVEPAAKAINEAAVFAAPFTLTAEGIGGFPSLKGPRVIWAGIKDHPGLTELRGKIEDGLAAIGFERDARRFHPHLTLCRIKSVDDSVSLGRAAQGFGSGATHEINVAEIILYKSVLKPEGSEHTALKRITLGPRR